MIELKQISWCGFEQFLDSLLLPSTSINQAINLNLGHKAGI